MWTATKPQWDSSGTDEDLLLFRLLAGSLEVNASATLTLRGRNQSAHTACSSSSWSASCGTSIVITGRVVRISPAKVQRELCLP